MCDMYFLPVKICPRREKSLPVCATGMPLCSEIVSRQVVLDQRVALCDVIKGDKHLSVVTDYNALQVFLATSQYAIFSFCKVVFF